jgi:phosphatidylserine/phosphatidylglycerophosphate/cardiolipin synthase-like enzyme
VNFSRIFLREEGVSFQLITSPPIEAQGREYISILEAEVLVNLGVELVIRKKPYLHSKVYQFTFPQQDQISFVGSANFTKGGLDRNDETVAMFRDPEVNIKVGGELDRLSSYGSDLYLKWKYNYALEKGVKDV